MKLGLGTVQFGLDYGITNQNGQIKSDEVSLILKRARKHGIQILDTAALYGQSEAVLGQKKAGDCFQVVTKSLKFSDLKPTSHQDALLKLKQGFFTSLERLQAKKIYGCLVHDAKDFLHPLRSAMCEFLQELKAQNLVQKIGVSLYSPYEWWEVRQQFIPDLVQIPFNLLDQRFLENGCLSEFEALGIEVHSRSAFLQGLLLQTEEQILPKFRMFSSLMKYQQIMHTEGRNRLNECLNFCLRQKEIHTVLVGVTRESELEQILGSIHESAPLADPYPLSCHDERLLLPSLWNNLK